VIAPRNVLARVTAALDGRRAALAWAAVTLLALLVLAPHPGVSRREAVSIAAADRFAASWGALVGGSGGPRALGGAPVADPGLAEAVTAATHALVGRFADALGYRTATALLAALLSAVLALWGFEIAGAGGAFLAPALFWCSPRALHHGLSAAPDLTFAALWLAAAFSWRRGLAAGAGLPRAIATGLLFGATAAAKAGGWTLFVILGAHALAVQVARRRSAPAPGAAAGAPRTAPAWRAIPSTLLAMTLLAPVVALAVAPWLWRDPGRLVSAVVSVPAGAPAGAGPVAEAVLAIPVGLLAACAGGLLHLLVRLVRAARARGDFSDDALLLLVALGPVGLAALSPAGAGLGGLLPALAVLALLAARALGACARTLWPGRSGRVLAALALLALYPAFRATAHHFPHGAAAWNEIAGGAPGAASRGLARQEGGEAAAAVLAELRTHARPGARVWWAGVASEAVRTYARDGRLREDLAAAQGPAEADLAVVPQDAGARHDDVRAWTQFRTARPVASFHLDEVALVHVYARPGAWR
jgi:hypothetical protein